MATGCGGSSAPAQGLLKHPYPAPSISGPTLTGGTTSLASLRGDVVVVSAYASWCAPCRAEAPSFVAAQRAYAAKGVRFLGILTRDDVTDGERFDADAGVTWPSIVDPTGVLLTKFKGGNAGGLPNTFVVDRQGRVAAIWLGAIEQPGALDAVLTTLTTPPATPTA